MRRSSLLAAFVVGIVILLAVRNVQASYSIATEKTQYQVGDYITVYVSTDGGTLTLIMQGPSRTFNINLGNLPAGQYTLPLKDFPLQPGDEGTWNVTLTSDACGGFCYYGDTHKPVSIIFTVVGPVPEFNSPLPVLAILLAASLTIVRRARNRK